MPPSNKCRKLGVAFIEILGVYSNISEQKKTIIVQYNNPADNYQPCLLIYKHLSAHPIFLEYKQHKNDKIIIVHSS